ncbi:MAG: TrmH family RNA methyltransferase [Candidatus Paceibacterota bacterium]|jgi:TrmH family RNA methyltransferase
MNLKVLKISKENAEFQLINALKTNREKRNHAGFLFEGVRNINNALKYGWDIRSYIYSSHRGMSDWAKNILMKSKAVTHYDVSSEILAKLSDKEEPSELMAIAGIPKDDLEKIRLTKNPLIVIFDRPSSPGNLGTLIRSCDAFGVDGLIVTGHAADVYSPESVRATTGSLFSFPIVRIPSQNFLVPWIEKIKIHFPNLQIIGTDENGSSTIYECDFKKPTIILAGNETSGLSAGYRSLATVVTRIPIQGSASSLNVAVATSIVISEAKRQRGL